MANANGWGDGASNNNIGWGQGAVNNNIGWGNSQLTSWSGATDIDGGNAPSNTVAPAITGTAQEGQTLTCLTGTWTGNPTPTYTYQWKRNGSNIGSATNSTYTLVTADVGTSIKCTVTATNAISSVNADSNTVTPTSSTDADAQAFITAAGITDPTQQSAINQLVVDLKGYSIWTKMKAIYPIVGGSASSHAVNLKTPGTYNLTFASGWTHSANGMTPSNAYADTNFIPSINGTGLNNLHISYYSRTNSTSLGGEIGIYGPPYTLFFTRYLNTAYFGINGTYPQVANTDSSGLILASRVNSTTATLYRNNNILIAAASSSTSAPAYQLTIGAIANPNGVGVQYYTDRQCAFASIGDGLTDTEAANFYSAVQAYQVTLGRSIGTQTVSDADAQAFVTAANITDQVQANAVNNLVIGMKADGLWTKMKAIYPVVGGVASSHAVNLKTPGTYNLTFATGWTHSSTGMTPNGSSAYANTALNPSSALTLNSTHLSFYSRTNNLAGQREIAVYQNADNPTLAIGTNSGAEISDHYNYNQRISASIASSTGFYIATRTTSISHKLYKNNTTLGTNTSTNTNALPNGNLFVGASNNSIVNTISSYSTKECAFASIGDGLTDTDATNLYNRVNTFQVTLNRNV